MSVRKLFSVSNLPSVSLLSFFSPPPNKTWLLGYEFSTTAIAILKDKVIFIARKNAKYFEPLKSKDILVWTRSDDAEHNKKLYEDLISEIKADGNVIGVPLKDKYEGMFVNEWKDAISDKGLEQVDVSVGLAIAQQLKDEEELRSIRSASKASMGVMTKFFADEMSSIIDEEKSISHARLAEVVEDKIEDEQFFRELKLGSEFDPGQLEWCYTPIIQSGGKYDVRPSALSDDNRLTPGVILCSLGLRYKSYCSNIARTYLIDPTKEQEQTYSFLLNLQKRVLESIKDGARCKDVYKACADYVKAANPDLEKHLVKNVGWGIGIDFRDTHLLLNAKNDTVLRDGMTLSVVIGFSDIPNAHSTSKANRTYSLLLTDTVRVTGDTPIVFTESPKARGDVSYYFKPEGVPVAPVKKEKTRVAANSAILKSKLRGETRNQEYESAEKRRQLQQSELHEKLQKIGEQRFADEFSTNGSENKAEFKKFDSYKRDTQIPTNTKDLRLNVDPRAQTILVPINGRPVPFHINTYKNGSKNEEGEYVYIRLNFHSPGQAGAAKKEDVPFEDPNAQFLRSITLRSRDGDRMSEMFKRIQDLKRDAVKREAEQRERADVVQQDKLIEVRNKRPLRLDAVYVRPGPEGKRIAGTLEIHQNGLRYQSPISSDQRIDVLFSNIAHLFFQPCDHELIVLVHVHLKNPIMVGKRKTKDVQFYREAADMAFDETGNRRRKYRYGDEDELEQEQEERRRRAALNKEFKAFSEQIAEASNGQLDVDVPFRDLGFEGVPFRANVLCQPTTDCLVQLVDPPFLVVTLGEIEVCHLERVQFGLKQFDLVFVYKDYNRPVTHINSIPMTQLDAVKDWLNEMEIPYYEGPVNLNWATIMKTVTANPHEFFASGGWSFLSTESGSESESESEEEESEFEVSDENPSDEESEEYSEDESEEYSEEASEDDDAGEDWDELDEQAEKEDKKRKR